MESDPVVPVDKCFPSWKFRANNLELKGGPAQPHTVVIQSFLFSSSDREMLLEIKPVYSKSVLEG